MGGGSTNKPSQKHNHIMMLETLNLLAAAGDAPATTNTTLEAVRYLGPTFALGVAGLGSAVGVGMVGAKAAEAVGRNPGAFGNILPISIIGMALAFFLYK